MLRPKDTFWDSQYHRLSLKVRFQDLRKKSMRHKIVFFDILLGLKIAFLVIHFKFLSETGNINWGKTATFKNFLVIVWVQLKVQTVFPSGFFTFHTWVLHRVAYLLHNDNICFIYTEIVFVFFLKILIIFENTHECDSWIFADFLWPGGTLSKLEHLRRYHRVHLSQDDNSKKMINCPCQTCMNSRVRLTCASQQKMLPTKNLSPSFFLIFEFNSTMDCGRVTFISGHRCLTKPWVV